MCAALRAGNDLADRCRLPAVQPDKERAV